LFTVFNTCIGIQNRDVKRGGGVEILVKDNNVSYSVDFVHPINSLFDLCCVDILVSNFTYRLICVYCPPYFTAEYKEDATLLCSGLFQLFLHQSWLFVAGDFNLPDIDWKFCMFPIDIVQDILFYLFTNNSLKQINHQPTRLNNIIDIFLTNIYSVVTDCNVQDKLGASDHETVLSDILLPLVSKSINATVKHKLLCGPLPQLLTYRR